MTVPGAHHSQNAEDAEDVRGSALTVVTVTRGRPDLVRRALRTVAAQDFAGPLLHLLLVDDDEAYRPLAAETGGAGPEDRSTVWHFTTRRPGDMSGPLLLARLRNTAVARATTPLVAFLDDDNLLEPHHFSSLLRCMHRTGCPAVHSQRRLLHRDGTPYLDRLSPWKRDVEAARARYAELRRHWVYVPWSNVIRDQVQPRDLPGRVQMVDTSEWLFRRDLLRRIPFTESYDTDDWRNVIGEDNKLLRSLVEADIPIASTHMPTLHYTLGGYSNAFRGDAVEGTW